MIHVYMNSLTNKCYLDIVWIGLCDNLLQILTFILEFIILIRNLTISKNLFLSLFYSIHYPTQIKFSLSQDKGQCDTLELLSSIFVSDIEI